MNTYRERNEAPYKQPIPDILSQIKDSYAELRPAERRVADIVLSDVAFAVDAARAARVTHEFTSHSAIVTKRPRSGPRGI